MTVAVKKRSPGSRTKLVPYSARRKRNARRPASGLEKQIHTLLKEEGISFVKEKAIGRCHVDVFIEPLTVVEIQGCFWHRHVCLQTKAGWSAADLAVQARDAARFAYLRAQGYKVVTVWECELKKDPKWVRALLRGLKA